MSNLTAEQLDLLTDRINSRLAEFSIGGAAIFEPATRGVVRLVHDVIAEWWEEDEPATVAQGDDWCGPEVNEEGEQSPADQWYGKELADIQRQVDNGYPGFLAEDEERKLEIEWDERKREEERAANVAATLGTEHTIVTPLKPIGRDHLPPSDIARGRLANAVAHGSDEARELVALTSRKPRTVPEVDGDNGFDQTPRARPHGKRGNVLPTLEDVVKELRRQSMGGVMPSLSTFNTSRPGNWAMASAQMQRLGISWDQLARQAGLTPSRAK